jgi:hypothetical protein
MASLWKSFAKGSKIFMIGMKLRKKAAKKLKRMTN